MRRIMDIIHDILQKELYNIIQKATKADKDGSRRVRSKRRTSSLSMMSQLNLKKPVNGEISDFEDGDKGKESDQKNQNEGHIKTLLINGCSVDVIMHSKVLEQQLKAVLIFSKSIIGYSLEPKHKAFLIEMLKFKGGRVMAIGDGFNDIGMLGHANVGIQVGHYNVPIIFGDLVIEDLSSVNTLMFVDGHIL